MKEALRFKLADSPAEFESIHRLNYRTFVEEIPQHPPNEDKRLVDRFHAVNTYAICLDGDTLVGMIAGCRARPFSLDAKLPDLDQHLPPHCKLVEVRLLAVAPPYRKQAVFAHLAGARLVTAVSGKALRAQICLMARWDPDALDVLPEVLSTQMQARSASAEERHPATEYVPAA